MTSVYVTNYGEETLVSSYNGIEYTFSPGETVEIPEAAARLIFAYGSDNKERAMTRIGFMKSNKDFIEAVERFMKFELSEQKPEKNHSLSPVVEQVVPMPIKARGRKPLHRVA